MERPSAIPQIPSTHLEQGAQVFSWVRYSLWKEATPDKAIILALQRRAGWISLALLLQSLAQIDPTLDGPYQTDSAWFGPLLTTLTAILPPLFVLGSFWAAWMAWPTRFLC